MSQRTITLKEWIEKEGISTIAKALRITESAVGHWRRGWVLPDTKQLGKIRTLTKGKVSIDKSLDVHFSAENKKNRYLG